MRYVIYCLLLVSSSLYAQTYPVEKKKLDILLDVYFYDHPSCTTALDKSHLAIDSLKIALTAGQTLIDIRTEERDLKVTESLIWEKRFENKEVIQKLERKAERRRGRKEGFIVGGGLGLVVLVLALL